VDELSARLARVAANVGTGLARTNNAGKLCGIKTGRTILVSNALSLSDNTHSEEMRQRDRESTRSRTGWAGDLSIPLLH
jgi:hypothetical protein